MMAQISDSRCAERCASLAATLAECEQRHGDRARCTTQHKQWHSFCITNSACNMRPKGRPKSSAPPVAVAPIGKRSHEITQRYQNAAAERRQELPRTASPLELRRRAAGHGLLAAWATSVLAIATALAADVLRCRWWGQRLALSTKMVAVAVPSTTAFAAQTLRSLQAAPRQTALGGELTLPMRVANALYEGPCVAVLSLTAPACAVIFAVESRNPATAGLDLSKRLMHTRVYGQGVAVAALVGVLAFVEVMGNDGGAYQVEAGRVVRKLHQDRG